MGRVPPKRPLTISRLCVDPDVADAVRLTAVANGMTISNYLRKLIRRSLSYSDGDNFTKVVERARFYRENSDRHPRGTMAKKILRNFEDQKELERDRRKRAAKSLVVDPVHEEPSAVEHHETEHAQDEHGSSSPVGVYQGAHEVADRENGATHTESHQEESQHIDLDRVALDEVFRIVSNSVSDQDDADETFKAWSDAYLADPERQHPPSGRDFLFRLWRYM